MHLVATHNTPPAFAEYRKRRTLPLKPNLPFGRMVEAKAVVHCADAAALPAYIEQRAVESGASRREAAEWFDVSPSSAIKWMQRRQETGSIAPKPSGGSSRHWRRTPTFCWR
jgi:hypothetical protein